MSLFQKPLSNAIELLDPLYTKMRSLGLAALALSSPTSPSRQSYHDNAGVLQYVNPKIGTSGVTPNGNGGMIPSVSPPFGMTRWTPQTRENFISQCPYNDLDSHIHGFQATHQPAIWMGESGQVVLVPGVGEVRPLFEERGHVFRKESERSTAYVYEVEIAVEAVRGGWNLKESERSTAYVYEVEIAVEAVRGGWNLTESVFSPVPGGGQDVPEEVSEGANGRVRRDLPEDEGEATVVTASGPLHAGPDRYETHKNHEINDTIKVAMTASSHVGHLRFGFPHSQPHESNEPYVFIQASRKNWTGSIAIDSGSQEVSGSNPQRQDYALGPYRAPGFSGYFVSRFSQPFASYGITHGASLEANETKGTGEHLGAWVKFDSSCNEVKVRTGVSLVSIEQARKNLDIEAPPSVSFDDAVETLKEAWLEKLDRVQIGGVNETTAEYEQRTIFYTGLFHGLQYPSDFSEPLETIEGGRRTWYEGYTDQVREGKDSYYQSWSIWDTFRAEHSLLTLFAPERVNGMMRSLLRIYDWCSRLPMWANVVETNIMIGTHVDAVIANALERNFTDFDVPKAWEAVEKNAFVPPINDTELLYYDREAYTPDEARAGLTAYLDLGYVPNDQWAESGSRTLDYAFDDFAASIVAKHAGDNETAATLLTRSNNYRNIYNANTTFMEARNANGTWAGFEQGWTEGDAWIYTFNVPHDPHGLAELLGGREKLKQKLDEYFASGQNDHSNEPSHHSPYLYAAIGYPSSTQNLTRAIAADNYNATAAGLSGNEDLGQMSAWYVFSALGFYPLNPASDEYVVGAPFFEKVTIRLPAGAATGGLDGLQLISVAVAYLRFPSYDYVPHHPESKSLNAGIWTIHFSLDNDMWSSEKRMESLLRESELDIIGLLESDQQRIIMGNRDSTQYLAEQLGMYVDAGPGPNKHTWGCALLSKFPIVNSTHHLLPSPHGELAPAIHATINAYDELIDVFVFHSGQEEDPLDRKLQMEYLTALMGSSPRPSILLSYLVTKPKQGNYNGWVSERSGMRDIDPSDWDRWCEYILYKGMRRAGYARISRSTITDTELQVGKFVVGEPEGTDEIISEDQIPENLRFPAIFKGQGVRGHRYHVFDEPRYYA